MSRGGRKAQPSKQFVVQTDGTVEEIAAQAYGDPSKSSLIWGANQLSSNEVKRGDVLIIPGEPPADKLTGKSKNDLTIIVDGLEIPMLNARIVRTMDTGADAWTGDIAWIPGEDRRLDEATRPYGYTRAAAYIGNDLQISGRLYRVSPKLAEDGSRKTLTGYSFTIDTVDSSLPPPYERENVTLEQLAKELSLLLGISVVSVDDSGGAFPRVTSHESDTMFAHLSKLATQRGLLISNTPQGDLLIHRAVTDGEIVGTLTEGDPLVTEWQADYDGRKRFHFYKCIVAGMSTAVPIWGEDNNDVGPSTVTSIDNDVPTSRSLTFRADDSTPGNIEDAARWRKNKHIVDALTQPLPVSDWYAPNGTLWAPNTLVTVVSATLGVPNGFTFLIRSVEFILEDRRSAVLNLVPPQAYSRNKELGDIWTLD